MKFMSRFKTKRDKRDVLFSIMIRERDNHTCQFCGKTNQTNQIQNSHFWKRGDKATRFDPENCDALCASCHDKHEGCKQGFYREWKLKQLGTRRYNALEKRARSIKKYGEYEKTILYDILKSQYKNERHLKPNWKVEW